MIFLNKLKMAAMYFLIVQIIYYLLQLNKNKIK